MENKIKIFLVDDDTVFRNALNNTLSKTGKESQEIRMFATGEECLQNLHQKPHVVILDYYLNGNYPDAMNGVQVLKKIKHMNPECEVIMVSSQDNIDVAFNTIEQGAYDYVTKTGSVFIKCKNGAAR